MRLLSSSAVSRALGEKVDVDYEQAVAGFEAIERQTSW
jgi:hypothetical protein